MEIEGREGEICITLAGRPGLVSWRAHPAHSVPINVHSDILLCFSTSLAFARFHPSFFCFFRVSCILAALSCSSWILGYLPLLSSTALDACASLILAPPLSLLSLFSFLSLGFSLHLLFFLPYMNDYISGEAEVLKCCFQNGLITCIQSRFLQQFVNKKLVTDFVVFIALASILIAKTC